MMKNLHHVDSRYMHRSVDNWLPFHSNHHHQNGILHCLPHHHKHRLLPIPNYGNNYLKEFQEGGLQPSMECHSHNLFIKVRFTQKVLGKCGSRLDEFQYLKFNLHNSKNHIKSLMVQFYCFEK